MTIALQSPSFLVFEEMDSEWKRLANPSSRTDIVFLPGHTASPYLVGFTVSERSLEQTLRLRYGVFNIELGEGLAESKATGMDRDAFDEQMTHVVVVDTRTTRIVATYRLQSVLQGLERGGLYSAREYDLSALEPYFPLAVECGRACIEKEHRTVSVLLLLWSGMRAFLKQFGLRWLFGCCSLTSRDPMEGWQALRRLKRKNFMHPEFYLPAREAYSCIHPPDADLLDSLPELELPKLFSTYMRLGTRVISEPAVDREFGTIDFLVLLDCMYINYSGLEMSRQTANEA